MTNDLAGVLGVEETAVLEFKHEAESSAVKEKINRTICALANDLTGQGGGDILSGVGDDGVPVGGADVSDAAQLRLTAIRNQAKILPQPSLTVTKALFAGKPVLRSHVVADLAPPLRYDGVVYVRPGPATMKATSHEEALLVNRKRALSPLYDLWTKPFTTQADLDLDLFRSSYLPSAVSPEVITENGRPLSQQLASLHMTSVEGHPTVLGLLILGFEPRSAVPGAYVQFVRYAGTDRGAPIANDQEFGGSLIAVVDRFDSILPANIQTAIVPRTMLTESRRPDYPWEAIRESLMNALMHRDYENFHAPTQINWFQDRIEITNPGGPFGRVRRDNFDHVNDYRNPSLAAAMKNLGYVNRFGRGISRIKESMAVNGNPAPEFVLDDAYWSVTLKAAR